MMAARGVYSQSPGRKPRRADASYLERIDFPFDSDESLDDADELSWKHEVWSTMPDGDVSLPKQPFTIPEPAKLAVAKTKDKDDKQSKALYHEPTTR